LYAFYDSAYRLSILICGYFFNFFCFTGGTKRFYQFKQMGVNKNVLQIKKMGVHFDTACPNE
jgi:hypothetical protein